MEELLKKLLAPKPTSDMSGFRFADLFDNNRWVTQQKALEDVAPKRQGDDVFFRQYVPREPYADPSVLRDTTPEGYDFRLPLAGNAEINAVPPSGANRRHYERNQGTTVKTVTSPEGGVTTTETTKYVPMDDNSYWRNEHRGYVPLEQGPVRTSGNPFGYPMRTAIQGPPRYTDVNQEMQGATPMMPISNARNFTPMAPIDNSRNFNPMIPIDQRTSEQTFAYNMVPLVRPEITPITTQRVPQGNRVPLSYNQQSQLNRFPFLGMDAMSDEERMRMLELLLIGRDD